MAIGGVGPPFIFSKKKRAKEGTEAAEERPPLQEGKEDLKREGSLSTTVTVLECPGMSKCYEKMTDSELVLAARTDPDALDVLCRRYLRDVQRVCQRILGDGRAQDAAQQAMLKFVRSVRQGRVNRNVKAFLLAIARYTSIDIIRKNERRRAKLPGIQQHLQEIRLDSFSPAAIKEAMFCLEQLPERTRQIVALKQDGLTFEEVGVVVGLKKSETHRIYHQGVKELRRLIAERGWQT